MHRNFPSRLSQHTSVSREKVNSSHVIGQSYGVVDGSSSYSHGSPTYDDAYFVVVHASKAHLTTGLDVVAPQDFPRCPNYMSLILGYTNHAVTHMWVG